VVSSFLYETSLSTPTTVLPNCQRYPRNPPPVKLAGDPLNENGDTGHTPTAGQMNGGSTKLCAPEAPPPWPPAWVPVQLERAAEVSVVLAGAARLAGRASISAASAGVVKLVSTARAANATPTTSTRFMILPPRYAYTTRYRHIY